MTNTFGVIWVSVGAISCVFLHFAAESCTIKFDVYFTSKLLNLLSWCPGPDLNRHARYSRKPRILRPIYKLDISSQSVERNRNFENAESCQKLITVRNILRHRAPKQSFNIFDFSGGSNGLHRDNDA